jgi:PKD repeat protein
VTPAAPTGAIRRVFLAFVVLSVLATFCAARAEAAWIAPVAVSNEGLQALDPQVAIDGQGNVTVAWVSGTSSRAIVVAEHPAGGVWTPGIARIQATEKCHDPKLAVNPAGAAVLAADCETSAAIRAATRTVNGTWRALSTEIPGSGAGHEPRVGIDNAGNAIAVWAGTASTVQSAYKTSTGGWISGGQVSTAGKVALEPNVAMSPAGYAHAIWREKREETGGDPVIEVKTSRKLGAAAWTAPFRLTNTPSPTAPVAEGEPQITINAGGERMMAWLLAGSHLSMAERASFADLGGVEPAKSILEATADVERPRIALDGNGLGVATWRSFVSAEGPRVKAAMTSSLGGSWSSPETVGGLGEVVGGTEPDVAAAPGGSATVVWRDGVTVKAASRPAGGAFAPGVPISSATQTGFGEPRVAMDAAGNATAAWSTGVTRIAVAVNDVTPPAISTAPPAPVVLGNAVGLNATAVDTWSPTTLSWSFGDGATASGGSVSHAYATAGTKTATVTATDAVGNSSSATVPVTVTPAPDAGGPGGGQGRHRVVLAATVVKQAWKQIAKAKAIKLRCKLDVAGTCAAKATVAAAVAKRIGLNVGKHQKPVAVGKGFAKAKAGKFAVVKVALTPKALAAIEAARKPVPIALAVTGSAAGNDPASLTRRLKISRP